MLWLLQLLHMNTCPVHGPMSHATWETRGHKKGPSPWGRLRSIWIKWTMEINSHFFFLPLLYHIPSPFLFCLLGLLRGVAYIRHCLKTVLTQKTNPQIYHRFFKVIFIYLPVLGPSCGLWDLVTWPGSEPRTPAMRAVSLSLWITREAPVP